MGTKVPLIILLLNHAHCLVRDVKSDLKTALSSRSNHGYRFHSQMDTLAVLHNIQPLTTSNFCECLKQKVHFPQNIFNLFNFQHNKWSPPIDTTVYLHRFELIIWLLFLCVKKLLEKIQLDIGFT